VSLALIVTLAVYAVCGPLLWWGLWRLTLPTHRRRVSVPGVLIDDTMVLTTDSDTIGLV
jgi:hypothetical protein